MLQSKVWFKVVFLCVYIHNSITVRMTYTVEYRGLMLRILSMYNYIHVATKFVENFMHYLSINLQEGPLLLFAKMQVDKLNLLEAILCDKIWVSSNACPSLV